MPDIKDRKHLVDALVEIVNDAGREIMKVYASNFDVVTKDDDSPLTQADLASHHAIRNALHRLTPDIPVLSEESNLLDFATRSNWSRYWLVDPLDGTKEFINRNGEFTVNIALIDGHRATLGVVGVPAQEIVYTGDVSERRAERRDRGGITAMHTRRMDRERELVVVASRSHGGERLEAFIDGLAERFNSVNRTPVGSSLKFCILAEGTRGSVSPTRSHFGMGHRRGTRGARSCWRYRHDVRSRTAALQHERVVAQSRVPCSGRRRVRLVERAAADRVCVNPSVALHVSETL
jgi:3'(2'), 5'-bisphosphate nucleotidase